MLGNRLVYAHVQQQFLLAAGLACKKSSHPTNITHTQMLFALAGGKLILAHTPSIMSIIGSGFILRSAIVVAIQEDSASRIGRERQEQ